MPAAGDSTKGDIRARTLALAARIIKLARALPRDVGAQVIARQVVRSGTSVGANVEEAQGAHSKKDFTRRMNIARTEARETLYWLRLIVESGMMSRRVMSSLIDETEQVVRILVSIVKTARERE